MASVHKQQGKPNWFCSFYGPDGKRHFRSTGTANHKLAESICRTWERAARKARAGTLTTTSARAIIEDGVSEILEINGQTLPCSSVRQFLTSWLAEKTDAGAGGTAQRYQGVVDRFLKHLGPAADRSMAHVTKQDVASYVDGLRGKVATGTINTHLKVLRASFNRAVKSEAIEKNPASLVDLVKRTDGQDRRAFTLPELRRLLDVATGDWRTAILVGLYTGLRLTDVANLSWANLDLTRGELTVRTRKTNRTVILPLAQPLLRHVESLPAGDDPMAPLCPSLEGRASGNLSQQFHTIMATAGLVAKRDHHAPGTKGKSDRRRGHELSYHALRHTATSLLKNAGVSEAVAMDIIGHESVAISRHYTHIDSATKKAAVDKLPDVTKG